MTSCKFSQMFSALFTQPMGTLVILGAVYAVPVVPKFASLVFSETYFKLFVNFVDVLIIYFTSESFVVFVSRFVTQ